MATTLQRRVVHPSSVPPVGAMQQGTLDLASDPAKMRGETASNPFTAELGLLTKLVEPRKSHAKEGSSMLAPKPVRDVPGRKRRAVPPLNDQEVAVGEVQTLRVDDATFNVIDVHPHN